MTPRLLLTVLFLFSLPTLSLADVAPKPDDTITYDVSAEDWVTTKTAHVTLDVEASVSGTNAGQMRSDMTKAVNDAAKADWRITNFQRTQDQTGLERWSVTFDARLPEADLNGLADQAKKASKAGMQIKVGDIDFTPTLDETEAVRATLRTHLTKEIADQLAALNATLTGRTYRISQLTFETEDAPPPPRPMHRVMTPNVMMATANPPEPPSGQDNAQKLTMTASVVFAALPPLASPAPPPLPSH